MSFSANQDPASSSRSKTQTPLFEIVFSSLLPQHFICIKENGFTSSCEYVSLSENCELLKCMYYAIFFFLEEFSRNGKFPILTFCFSDLLVGLICDKVFLHNY